MKYINRLWILTFLTVFHYSFAKEENRLCQFVIAVDLCHETCSDEGFVAAKVALEQYKEDEKVVKLLKESMTCCVVGNKYISESIENADEIIKTSSNPFYIGCAWFQKSRYAWLENNNDDALTYSSIALKCLQKDTTQVKEGQVSHREFFESLCHKIRHDIYEAIGDKEKADKENTILQSFKFLKHEEKNITG